ncbi:MAG: ROK family protein [Saprospiraceae bacterium]|nr:ROK family protein [Saprospiraceae bacterium]MCB9328043.1 ROK family protein [Lewinellaceae bacterium]
MKKAFGIDVGGTGIKGAIVDVEHGELLTERRKFLTPKPATPDAVIKEAKNLLKSFDWKKGVVGIGFPAVVINGICKSAVNIDKKWINFPVKEAFEQACGNPVSVINDADAAGIAEMKFGAGMGVKGSVLMLTLGTGIGSSLFIDGKLIPNIEFGQLVYKKSVAEHYGSNKHREQLKLSWKDWGASLNGVIKYYEKVCHPELIILGGGVSKKFDSFSAFLKLDAPVIPAKLLNGAGTIGAAYFAVAKSKK